MDSGDERGRCGVEITDHSEESPVLRDKNRLQRTTEINSRLNLFRWKYSLGVKRILLFSEKRKNCVQER